ncbi:fatty acyl-AMP ligase [Actinospica sp.]|uniref:fatty acyl-AMP ligase n=1 Tax=Actinospica sp. TaxID=1872142 RepID=UPI002C7FA1B4|nr:fatty acyl-AMP ligase [Actinospica sp.]HWG22585.1 fatty acyl-AMP ligase [Actinospica sp.]
MQQHRSMPAPDLAAAQSLPGLLRDLAARHAHQRAFTFVDYPDLRSDGRSHTLTWAQLHDRARAVAAQVRAVARPGDRAVLLMPQGLDYVAGFLGCLAAGVVAVPLFPTNQPGHANRVAAVLEDCEPACALVTESTAAAARTYLDEDAGYGRLPLVQVDVSQPLTSADPETEWIDPSPGDVAYLQYTSGSTRSPAGVMITHENVVRNARQVLTAFPGSTVVSWLPLFHDMGLVVNICMPVVGGFPSVLMDPVAFLARPERWLRLIGAHPNVFAAAPNFAYDYCVAKVRPEAVADLRLDQVHALGNGAEPIRPRTLRAFAAAFAGTGLRPEMLCPSYGLAEATVFVASDGAKSAPYEVTCHRAALAEGRIVPAAADADEASVTTLVACGKPVDQEIRIVEPGTRRILPDGAVGEILVRGANVGLGYWKRAEQSAEVFGAVLAGTGEQPWLRTGDLGAIHDGRLLVTGRLKDLLIIDGRNHYPQDVEETVHAALEADRRERAAVFAVPGAEGESVVAVAERRRDRMKKEALAAASAEIGSSVDHIVRARVAGTHGLRLDQLVLVPPGTIPRTSSGKVSRSACRAAYLRGDYAEGRR